MPSRWSVSVISHGHGASVARVLMDIHAQLGDCAHELILTLNAGEDEHFLVDLPTPLQQRLRVIRNRQPRGFAANHNTALRGTNAEFVLMADPDLSLSEPLLTALESALADPLAGIVAPRALTPEGLPEDNGRSLVTPAALLRRYLLGPARDAARLPVRGVAEVDWLAGLFLAMRADTFRSLGGFDEGYHLYCEDVDLCLRARLAGLSVRLLCDLRVTHPARRATRRQLQHLRWHAASLLRLWRSPVYHAARRLKR
jgi:N-acetylglucosaminyl-diphospho-decaprenol L-rhamnosyltransferase